MIKFYLIKGRIVPTLILNMWRSELQEPFSFFISCLFYTYNDKVKVLIILVYTVQFSPKMATTERFFANTLKIFIVSALRPNYDGIIRGSMVFLKLGSRVTNSLNATITFLRGHNECKFWKTKCYGLRWLDPKCRQNLRSSKINVFFFFIKTASSWQKNHLKENKRITCRSMKCVMLDWWSVWNK